VALELMAEPPLVADEGTVRDCPVCFDSISANKEWVVFSACRHGTCWACFRQIAKRQCHAVHCPLCRMSLVHKVLPALPHRPWSAADAAAFSARAEGASLRTDAAGVAAIGAQPSGRDAVSHGPMDDMIAASHFGGLSAADARAGDVATDATVADVESQEAKQKECCADDMRAAPRTITVIVTCMVPAPPLEPPPLQRARRGPPAARRGGQMDRDVGRWAHWQLPPVCQVHGGSSPCESLGQEA
jgi:hypothetical protein